MAAMSGCCSFSPIPMMLQHQHLELSGMRPEKLNLGKMLSGAFVIIEEEK